MSTGQVTASPRAPRGKNQQVQGAPAHAPQSNNGRQGQRRPKGGRNNQNQQNQAGASPSRHPQHANPALAESAVFPSEEAQSANGPRHNKKHTRAQPSGDRVFSPPGAMACLTDSEGAPPIPISATPAKNQGAYAGPTFHASPAPSALPIPKFLSRSVPAKSRMDPPTPPPEDSSDSTGSPNSFAGSPSRAPIPVPARNEMSPLDLLFKADRAERAKHVGGSPASPQYFNSANPVRPHHYKQDSYGSLNAPFPIELDGESRNSHMSPPPTASPMAVRSSTDPNKIPQLKDAQQQPSKNEVMQDLLTRLSMSQKKPTAATPPRPDTQTRNETPSPLHDSQSAVQNASGPTTPAQAPQEPSDYHYGNRNLSPLFKAAKGEPSKRNSGLRTEITADSPLVAQGMFQDFPSVSSPPAMDPNTYSRNYPVGGSEIPTGPRRGSPYVQPHRGSPNHGNRRTPGRQPNQHRPDAFSPKPGGGAPGAKATKSGFNGTPVSVQKPATSMMSFVPASVSAKPKQLSSSAPSTAAGPPPMKTSTPPNTLALEQDLKRMLNLKMSDDASGVR
ncbi:hypothetical protein HBI56_114710 [Parastagonospora nodorum]|nr:hypothetical protein HBH52_118410 [Parastagonospora nodorum]KAH4000550.1 hypothetical protein HBI10_102980 [Parastagonospora nodorum]KAH4026473.1 hypothetical protein HBI13_062630 [Parastagonospora nodorum]KAH4068079.1 hypothetical protein HBH50_122240 [Parastagonospora nodorum]KAH4085686.1 hypothetical protein HBH48_152920 [Parastagonospora nodorum]